MLDFKGQELNVGDKVIIIHKEYLDIVQTLREGIVTRMTPQKVEVEIHIPARKSYGTSAKTIKLLKAYPEFQLYKLG